VGQQPDLRLILTKNIPAGTGLGSASSDAATTLLGLNRYLDLGLAPDALHEMAASLGSDVAFFLHGPLAYCTGRGEIVTALPAPFAFVAILVLPNINVSTAKVYKNYLHDHQNYETLHRQISAHISKNRIDFFTTLCTNMLSSTCYELETNLASLKDRVEACGLGPVCLSGSGSALVCWIKGGIEKARECQCTIERATNCLTRIVTHNGW
jgi:4-diphosphocytidyl-2-C-methyl-D-erythritol kinase